MGIGMDLSFNLTGTEITYIKTLCMYFVELNTYGITQNISFVHAVV